MKNYFDECEKDGIDVGSCAVDSVTCYEGEPTKLQCKKCRCSKCERSKCSSAMNNSEKETNKTINDQVEQLAKREKCDVIVLEDDGEID